MPTGFGVSPDDQGNGTTPEDIQRIIAADYQNAGIIDGADVKGTATMNYSVTAGAVILSTGTDMAVKVPVQATTVPTNPAPATGFRTDTIYVRQLFPGSDGSSVASVGVVIGGTTLPPNSILLQQFRVNAGVTATTAAIPVGNRKFAVPTGGSRGRIFVSSNDIDGTGVATKNVWKRNAGTFFVPTDRDIELDLKSTAMSCLSTGAAYPRASWTAMAEGSIFYKFYVDDVHIFSWERSINGFAETKQIQYVMAVAEGAHTVHYTTEFQVGPSDMHFKFPKGGTDKFMGDVFSVWDRGVIQGAGI